MQNTAITSRVHRLIVSGLMALLLPWHAEAATGKLKPNQKQALSPEKRITQHQLQQIGETLKQRIPIRPQLARRQSTGSPLTRALSQLQSRPLSLQSRTSERGDLHIVWHETNGTPIAIDGESLRRFRAKPGANATNEDIALAFIQANRDIFRLQDPQSELVIDESFQDMDGQFHVRFQQMYQGIPVWGQELTVHLDANGEIYAINARYSPTPRLELGSNMAASEAISIAEADVQTHTPVSELSPQLKNLLDYDGPRAKQYVWIGQDGTERLVWHVQVRPNLRDNWYYFIDAETGKIVEKYNATVFEGPTTGNGVDLNGVNRTLNVYQKDGTYFMIDASRPIWQANQPDVLNKPKGALWTISANNTDLDKNAKLTHVVSQNNQWTDPVAVSAHYNMGKVFEYYYNVHQRKAIDGKGSTIISVIHITENGQGLDNAFWNGAVMGYGDGNKAFKPLAGALDVAAHEMTHGVVERTVNLEYKFQSGALNESISDVFGAMVDRDDWKIGEDVVKPSAYPSGALRDMQNPNNGGNGPNDPGWQPKHMNEFLDLPIEQNNGGVHYNSGIPNRACYLIAQAIGRDKTEKIYYQILDKRYLNKQAKFIDLRLAAIRAAEDLYGKGSNEVNSVKAAFDAVGITGETGTKPPADIPPSQGDEWIAVVNAEYGDNSLILARPVIQNENSDIVQITTTQLFTNTGNPFSISDDGSVVIFIDQSNNLWAMNIDGSNQTLLDDSGVWSSVALAPDASKLALTSTLEDSAIYIIDLQDANRSRSIHLYSPTTQEGVRNNITVFADALDWDLSSRYLIYDAFNRVPRSEGDPLEFWDVSILDVNTDVIYRIFPPQPEGISIGNPSFAFTSNNLIVFEYVDFNNATSTIMTADLFQGVAQEVLNNGSYNGLPNLSFAKYAPNDRALIFQRIEGGAYMLYQLPLKDDRMSPAGSESFWASGAQLPYWFAIGRRQLPTSVDESPPATPSEFALLQNYPNPFNPETRIQFQLQQPAHVRVIVFDNLGRQVAELLNAKKAAGTYTVQWNARDRAGFTVPGGVYFYRIEAVTADGRVFNQTRKMVLLK